MKKSKAKRAAKRAVAKGARIAQAAKPGRKKPAARVQSSAKVAASRDWRAELLSRLRGVILAAAPGAVEERKWAKATNPAGVPTWSLDGILCTGETYQKAVKLTFARGAALADPARLFNAGLEGNVRRAIDFHEGDAIDETALAALVRAAVALNRSKA